eukprot:5640335-Pleurochrysis_carterae.AAC.1
MPDGIQQAYQKGCVRPPAHVQDVTRAERGCSPCTGMTAGAVRRHSLNKSYPKVHAEATKLT